MSSIMKDHVVEKKLNEFIKEELDHPAEKLMNFSLNLIERNKILNEDSHRIIEMQKNLKLKEINNSNKKMELLILEKRLKDKHGNKVNLKNILECYSIILKNNDELLKRRLEQLKERDFNLKKKEFLLSKIKSNEFKLGPNFIAFNEKKSNFNKQQKVEISEKIIDEELIFEEIKNQFKLFQNAKMRNLSIDNLSLSNKKKLEVQNNEQIHISKFTNSKDKKNLSKICTKNHNYKNNLNERNNNDFNRITEENEDHSISRRHSTDKKNKNLLSKSREKENNFPDWNKEKEKEISLLIKNSSDKNEITSGAKKTNRFNNLSSKDYKSDENEENYHQNQSKESGNIRAKKDLKFGNKGSVEQRTKNITNISKDVRNNKKSNINSEKEVFSETDKSIKITKLVKNKSTEDTNKSMNIRSVKSKGIVKITSNFVKDDKNENQYRGLARNLSGNKSFDNVRNASIGNPSLNNKNDNNINQFNPEFRENLKDKNVNQTQENKKNININKKKNDINKDILDKLLKEAEEDTKKRENTTIKNNQNNKENKIIPNNNPQKNFNIDFNDENLLKISNILGHNKKVQTPSGENSIHNDKSTINKQNNNMAEGLFLLNQNGIFKNKNENLKIQSGLNLNLDEEKQNNSNRYNKANTDSNRRERSLAGNDSKFKDRIIYKDAEKDKENDIISKKSKRNTVFLGKDMDKKLNIGNMNHNKKEIPNKKNEINKRNSQLKDNTENINNQNKNNNTINNDYKQYKIENKINILKQEEKDAQSRKHRESRVNKISEYEAENENPLIESYIKKLEFDNLNKSSNIVIKKETNVTNIRQKEINRLLESKKIDGEKDNDMMVIIESEQILKDEIYIQKITQYDEELLIKKQIQFNNDLNLDDLRMNSLSIEKQEKSYQRNSKLGQNERANKDKNQNFIKNQSIGNVEDSSEKGNSIVQDSFNNHLDNDNDNLIEYEKEFTKTNSQTNLDGSNILNSPIINFTRGSLLEKKNTPFNNLQKSSFDSRDESPNNSNNTNNKNKMVLNNIEKKNNKNQIKDNKTNNSPQRGNNSNNYKRNSTKEHSNVNLKKNLLNDKDLDLTDSLDGSYNKISQIKYRNSVESRTNSNRITKNDLNNNQIKGSNNHKNNKNRSDSSNVKTYQNNDNNRDKEESLKRKNLNSNNSYCKELKKPVENQNCDLKDSQNKNNKESMSNQSDKNCLREIEIKKDQNPSIYEKTDSKEIKDSNFDFRMKANESNRNIHSDNTTNKDSTDNTVSSTRNMDRLSIKMDNSNLGSDINGKYDTCLDDDEDDEKIVDYQEYIKKMKQMAAETKMMEDNMRQFANIVQNMVENNKTDA